MRSLYTNHGLVLMRIWLDPYARLSDIAADIGIRERAVYLIVQELVEEGFIEKRKVGRRNQYRVNYDRALDYEPLPNTTVRQQIMVVAGALGMRPAEPPQPGAGAVGAGAREPQADPG